MKTKLLGIAVLSIIILPFLTTAVFAEIANDSGCTALGGTCGKEAACTAGTIHYKLCPGLAAADNVCCVPNKISKTTPAGQTSVTIPNPLKATSIPALIDNIVNYLIGIATIILPIAVIYSAYLFMSAGGDMEKVIKGRQALTWTIVGYALILISKGVTMLVASILGAK